MTRPLSNMALWVWSKSSWMGGISPIGSGMWCIMPLRSRAKIPACMRDHTMYVARLEKSRSESFTLLFILQQLKPVCVHPSKMGSRGQPGKGSSFGMSLPVGRRPCWLSHWVLQCVWEGANGLLGSYLHVAAQQGYALPSVGWNIMMCFYFAVLPNDCFFLEMGMFSKGLSTFTVNIM